MQIRIIILVICSVFTTVNLFGQAERKDSVPVINHVDTGRHLAQPDTVKKQVVDSSSIIKKKEHDPHKATLRSAILPGLGQAYNREYWKIPIVYGALAIPTATFIYNNSWYRKTKYAYNVKVNNDTANFKNIDPQLQDLSASSLQTYRNIFRKDRDLSILWFFILWGLNVVDATVFGHLKAFDINDDLSMQVNPTIDPGFKRPGVSLVFNLKNNSSKAPPPIKW